MTHNNNCKSWESFVDKLNVQSLFMRTYPHLQIYSLKYIGLHYFSIYSEKYHLLLSSDDTHRCGCETLHRHIIEPCKVE